MAFFTSEKTEGLPSVPVVEFDGSAHTHHVEEALSFTQKLLAALVQNHIIGTKATKALLLNINYFQKLSPKGISFQFFLSQEECIHS